YVRVDGPRAGERGPVPLDRPAPVAPVGRRIPVRAAVGAALDVEAALGRGAPHALVDRRHHRGGHAGRPVAGAAVAPVFALVAHALPSPTPTGHSPSRVRSRAPSRRHTCFRRRNVPAVGIGVLWYKRRATCTSASGSGVAAAWMTERTWRTRHASGAACSPAS